MSQRRNLARWQLRSIHLKGAKGGSHDTVEASSPRTEKHRTKAQKSKSVWTRNIDASSLALGLVSFEQEALYEIDAALKRIEDGTYGVCELTGKAIPWERLEKIPWTRFSIEAENQLRMG